MHPRPREAISPQGSSKGSVDRKLACKRPCLGHAASVRIANKVQRKNQECIWGDGISNDIAASQNTWHLTGYAWPSILDFVAIHHSAIDQAKGLACLKRENRAHLPTSKQVPLYGSRVSGDGQFPDQAGDEAVPHIVV